VVTISSVLQIFNADGSPTNTTTLTLENWPYIENYEKNFTVSGYLCYNKDLAEFNIACNNSLPGKDWISI